MENPKKRKNLVCSSTTAAAAAAAAAACTTITVCAPESSAPVAKRRKEHSVDKDLSSASHAPLAKTRRFGKWRRPTTENSDRPFSLYVRRVKRREIAIFFRRGLNLSSVFRYHIRAGVRVKKWQATSFGIPWAGVHGKHSICVVARRKDLLRLHQDLQKSLVKKSTKYFLSGFWNSIVSEIEGKSHMIRKRPFGVVSVIKQDSNKKVHKASSAEYDAEKAVEFLQEEMESGAVFTFDKTTQTAISAFQHLFGKEFEADEIQAFVVECNRRRKGRELKQSREDFDIEEIQAIINGDGDGAGA